MPLLYWLIKFVFLGPFVHTVYRPWIVGVENIPESGPVIFAVNHLSFVDSIFLPLLVDRHIVYLAKSEYFTGAGVKGWFSRMFFSGVGQVPIDRSGGKASEAALDAGLGVLASGRQLGIYPEGTRSPDGRLYRGRTGIARMLLESEVTVVPIAMIDTDKVLPTGSIFPRLRKVGVVIGEPMDFSRFAGLEGDRFVLRSITDEIMHKLSKLSGQEYVDVYASSVKSRSAAAVRRPA
ncbi:MAG: lysophospholipid acyltransferase family protein [Pseudolysinimonas sp.]|uniref:lysophospholipid acyltransferase family protein n=1 Tax=Pseudolysinimonas sp. TaxID=2680009 RepID=UPI0032674052